MNILPWILVLTVPAGAAEAVFPQEQQQPGKSEIVLLDERHDLNTWVNKEGPIDLAVNVYVSRGSEGREYFPLEIAIANPTQKGISLTRDSFTLYDQAGTAYPVATPKEIIKKYHRLGSDRTKLTRNRTMIPVFQGYQTIRSQMEPNPRPQPGVSNVVMDRVDIPSGYMISDLLYFKMPVTKLTGKYLELRMTVKGYDEPMTVKFMVDMPEK